LGVLRKFLTGFGFDPTAQQALAHKLDQERGALQEVLQPGSCIPPAALATSSTDSTQCTTSPNGTLPPAAADAAAAAGGATAAAARYGRMSVDSDGLCCVGDSLLSVPRPLLAVLTEAEAGVVDAGPAGAGESETAHAESEQVPAAVHPQAEAEAVEAAEAVEKAAAAATSVSPSGQSAAAEGAVWSPRYASTLKTLSPGAVEALPTPPWSEATAARSSAVAEDTVQRPRTINTYQWSTGWWGLGAPVPMRTLEEEEEEEAAAAAREEGELARESCFFSPPTQGERAHGEPRWGAEGSWGGPSASYERQQAAAAADAASASFDCSTTAGGTTTLVDEAGQAGDVGDVGAAGAGGASAHDEAFEHAETHTPYGEERSEGRWGDSCEGCEVTCPTGRSEEQRPMGEVARELYASIEQLGLQLGIRASGISGGGGGDDDDGGSRAERGSMEDLLRTATQLLGAIDEDGDPRMLPVPYGSLPPNEGRYTYEVRGWFSISGCWLCISADARGQSVRRVYSRIHPRAL